MDDHFLSVEEFNELLQQWSGRKIKVSKLEMDDYDETLMELKEVSYDRNTRRIDDYEPMHTLQLNGTGKVQTENNTYQHLPINLYEIPLQDSTLYEFDGSQFILSTDRGVYKIEISE